MPENEFALFCRGPKRVPQLFQKRVNNAHKYFIKPPETTAHRRIEWNATTSYLKPGLLLCFPLLLWSKKKRAKFADFATAFWPTYSCLIYLECVSLFLQLNSDEFPFFKIVCSPTGSWDIHRWSWNSFQKYLRRQEIKWSREPTLGNSFKT